MTEKNGSAPDLALTARLARTRLAVRATVIVERGWPLVLPLLLVALPVPQPVLARRLPHAAGHGEARPADRLRPGVPGRALSAALLSRADRGRDRPPHRTRKPARAYAGAGADRPAERPGQRLLARLCGANTSAAWRRAWAASVATCRARACPNATRGACARRPRCCW